MQFEDSKVILFHGVLDLRKGAAGLLALVDDPEPHTWYLFSKLFAHADEARAPEQLWGLDGDSPFKSRGITAGWSIVAALRFSMQLRQRTCVRKRSQRFTINLFLCFHFQ